MGSLIESCTVGSRSLLEIALCLTLHGGDAEHEVRKRFRRPCTGAPEGTSFLPGCRLNQANAGVDLSTPRQFARGNRPRAESCASKVYVHKIFMQMRILRRRARSLVGRNETGEPKESLYGCTRSENPS